MTTLFEVLHKRAEPYKVTLTKGQKGAYGWEITVSAETYIKAHNILNDANRDLKALFGGGEQHE